MADKWPSNSADANPQYIMEFNGSLFDFKKEIRATAIKKYGGTSSQFLKADGSVDSTDYLASSSYTAANVLAKLLTVDGSGSGLDADMLDGVHLSGLFRVADFNEDANALSVSGAYKTVASIINTPLNANGNQLIHLNWDSNAANQLFLRYNTDAMYFRRKTGGVWHDWKQFAFTDSNVASATKLANTRTIWGQNFNGEGNVSGDMTGVGNITFKGDIFMQGYTTSYARGFHVLGATSGTRIATICGIVGNNDSYSRIYFGGDYNAPFLCLLPTGNIAVGKTTADYKFDVAGDIHSNGDMISEGAIAAKAVKVATVFAEEGGEEVEA